MIFYVLMLISVIVVIYGALVFKRMHTPYMAKATVQEEFMNEWCKTEGITKMLLGIDFACLGLYVSETFLKWPGLIAAIALGIYITKLRYDNNAKYLK